MPTLLEYSTVLESLTSQGLRSLYHNSGAFGFSPEVLTVSRGWIGEEDASIRENMRTLVRRVPVPAVEKMTDLMLRFWQETVPGPVWVMPKSHWAYELEFGSREWMPAVLTSVGIDPASLIKQNNGTAIEFGDGEKPMLRQFVLQLLTQLVSSDFQIIFPGKSTICTIHHRGQLWWTTADLSVLASLDELLPADGSKPKLEGNG